MSIVNDASPVHDNSGEQLAQERAQAISAFPSLIAPIEEATQPASYLEQGVLFTITTLELRAKMATAKANGDDETLQRLRQEMRNTTDDYKAFLDTKTVDERRDLGFFGNFLRIQVEDFVEKRSPIQQSERDPRFRITIGGEIPADDVQATLEATHHLKTLYRMAKEKDTNRPQTADAWYNDPNTRTAISDGIPQAQSDVGGSSVRPIDSRGDPIHTNNNAGAWYNQQGIAEAVNGGQQPDQANDNKWWNQPTTSRQ